jgi:hypothetical protein
MKILYHHLSHGEVSRRDNSSQIFRLKFGMHLASQNKEKQTTISSVINIIRKGPFKNLGTIFSCTSNDAQVEAASTINIICQSLSNELCIA